MAYPKYPRKSYNKDMSKHGLNTKAMLILGIVFLFIIQACSLSTSDNQALESQVNSLQSTVIAMQVNVAVQQTLSAIATPTPLPTSTNAPAPTPVAPTITPTPGPSVVTEDTLCWIGPGGRYEVVSSLKNGTQVELLGKGNVSGWWVILNPRYHDPCWIMQEALRVDPNTNTASLTVYSAPPVFKYPPYPYPYPWWHWPHPWWPTPTP